MISSFKRVREIKNVALKAQRVFSDVSSQQQVFPWKNSFPPTSLSSVDLIAREAFEDARNTKFNRLNISSIDDIQVGAQSAFGVAVKNIFDQISVPESIQTVSEFETNCKREAVRMHDLFDLKLVDFYSSAIKKIKKEKKYPTIST